MSAPALALDDVSRAFGDVVALEHVTFHVDPGAIVGFVGANGAGKTTAMRIIMGVERADSGQVCWQGKAIAAADRRRFGYMPEERGLYPKMRARDQLVYLARLHGLTARDATEEATRLLARFGLEDRASDAVENLSLGNQQRVQLAAALVHRPDLLVLDEPFSGLDPVGIDALATILREAADEGTPILFSSHQLELVERLCDAVAIINRGRVVANGDVEELRRGGERRLRVGVRSDNGDWTRAVADMPAVEILNHDGDELILRLGDAVDEQAILDHARRHGPVTTFAPDTPSLAERYREVTGG